MSAIKQWSLFDDSVLSVLCRMLVERRLPGIELSNKPYDGITFETLVNELVNKIGLSEREALYFVKTGEVQNKGYDRGEENIRILSKNGDEGDIYEISDMLSAKAFSQITKKYFLCTPKKYYF
jgi:hypothetical protein